MGHKSPGIVALGIYDDDNAFKETIMSLIAVKVLPEEVQKNLKFSTKIAKTLFNGQVVLRHYVDQYGCLIK